MVQLSLLALALAAASVQGAPLTKRIAQVISDSTKQWEAACDAAGGGLQCNPVAVAAFGTLLAAAGPCDQQNGADNMIDLAKQHGNDPNMIKFAQIFAQQPRNTPSSQSVQYCQQAPKNSELNGLFQCQFKGANPTTFVGGVAVGQPGTIPFGKSSPISPPGSCPANPGGPIADGSQLVDITQNPGVGNTGGSSGGGGGSKQKGSAKNNNPPSTTTGDPPAQTPEATPPSSSKKCGVSSQSTDAPDTPPPANTPAANGTSGNGNFHLQNGQDAQKLNAKFAGLNANSPCNAGDQACVNGGFAQCVGGKFVVTQCAAGTTCAALPLVNKPGTSLACTTSQDALDRIAASGAKGGLTGA